MLKYAVYAIIAVAVIALIAGGIHLCKVYFKNKKEMSAYSGTAVEVKKDFGKALVVYYSLSGNTRAIAEKIKEKTGADIYEIRTKEAVSSGPGLHLDVRKQLKSGTYPALAGDLPDMEPYDIIFVGSPVWWYTVATPVLSFLEQADFQGKRVVPFSTQGSNPGAFYEDFKAKAKNAVVLQWEGFNNLPAKYDKAVDNKVAVWLSGIGQPLE